MHKLVKILADDDGEPVETPAWHLVNTAGGGEMSFCTGEFFGSGESSVVFELKEVKRGGITCKDCLSRIKAIKAVRL